MGISVNKSQLEYSIAKQADIPKDLAGSAMDAMIESICGALKDGDQVALVGFGTFLV
jgi:DNA-binding protein HU-beta